MSRRRKIGVLEKLLGKAPLKKMLGRSPLTAAQKALSGKKSKSRKRK
jgi:hypothetical protein